MVASGFSPYPYRTCSRRIRRASDAVSLPISVATSHRAVRRGEITRPGGAVCPGEERYGGVSALRSSHETAVLETIRETKRQHVAEARRQLEAIQKTRKVTEER